MGIRLIVLLPLAALMTSALIVLASSTHSVLERRFVPDTAPTITLVRYESDCDRIAQRLDELARAATTCDGDPSCLVSPLVCPIQMTASDEREYGRLLERFESECGSVRRGEHGASLGMSLASESCGLSQQALDPRRETSAREVFIF